MNPYRREHLLVCRLVHDTLCECSSSRVVLGFRERSHGLSQREDEMLRLQPAMREVRCKLELPLNVRRLGV